MTHVVTISELQKLIPETLQLEGQNYSDMKILLSSIIETVEKTGKWQFVQYIQNKPSLFIVREVKPMIITKEDLTRTYNYDSVGEKNPYNKTKNSQPPPAITQNEQYQSPPPQNGTTLFPVTNLPWK